MFVQLKDAIDRIMARVRATDSTPTSNPAIPSPDVDSGSREAPAPKPVERWQPKRVGADVPKPGQLIDFVHMTPYQRRAVLLSSVIVPSMDLLRPYGIPFGADAARMMLAIAGQESGVRDRQQVPVAHAMGLWQFERGGGVMGVMRHSRTKTAAASMIRMRGLDHDSNAVWLALANDDALAAIFARLLLWSDSHALPGADEMDRGWGTYLFNWRPGKPHRERWPENWRLACAAVDNWQASLRRDVIAGPAGS